MSNPLHVMITGATGAIGGAIAHRWAALGMGRVGEVQVSALVRDPQSAAAQNLAAAGVRLMTGNLLDEPALRAALTGQDILIHAAGIPAAKAAPDAQHPQPRAAVQVYEIASAVGVRRMIAFSSLLVYAGRALAGETHQPAPTGDLETDLRLVTEDCLRSVEQPDGARLVILRLGHVYGPGVRRWTREPIERAKQRRLNVPGPGSFALPYLFIDNLVDAVTAAALADSGGIYDIYDGFTSYSEFLGHYARMAGVRLGSTPLALLTGRTWLDEQFGRLTGSAPRRTRSALRALLRELPENPPRAEKALKELGWQPRVSLEEGMQVIERSNGFHKTEQKKDVNPWQENENWTDEHTDGGGSI